MIFEFRFTEEFFCDPYCDGNVLKRKRPFYDYYCSDGACKSRTTYDYELIETCQYGCDNGRCNPSPSCDRTDTSCGNYPNCQNCNNKDDWYDVGSPYSCCNGDNTGTCTCQQKQQQKQKHVKTQHHSTETPQ